jgi:integrase
MELKENNHSNHVLPGISIDKSLTENALPRAIKRIQDRIGIPEWHAHDLRRTFST